MNENPESNIFKFKFKNGKNYSLSENGLVATKTSGGKEWNCIISGDRTIPKNKISKWKIKLINFEFSGDFEYNILIGIGPEIKENSLDFYKECWTFCCGTSQKVIKSTNPSKYLNNSGKLKEGDIIEVTLDRTSGNLSFAVNDFDYGIACSQIPKEDNLYPIIMLYYQNQKIELIESDN